MGYIIKYDDITLLYDYLKLRSMFVLNKLGNIEKVMNEIISSEDYLGEYAKKIKDYFNNIQLPVIKAISKFYSTFPYYVLLLAGELMTVESDSEAVLYEDLLTELSGELQKAVEYIDDMAVNINNEINKINNFVDIDNITAEPFINNGLGYVKSNIDSLNQGIYDVEESFYNSELYKLEELYDSLIAVIDKMSKIGQINILQDDYYALFPMDDIKKLEDKVEAVDIEDKIEYLEYLHRLCNAQDSYEINSSYTIDVLLNLIRHRYVPTVDDISIFAELVEFGLRFTEFCGEKYLYKFTDTSIKEWLCYYVPNYISDETLIYAMTLISSPLDNHTIQHHLEHNRELWLKYIKDGGMANNDNIFEDGYIVNQGALNQMYYGVDGGPIGADYNSCEIIALYNALYAVNGGVTDPKYDFPELIAQIEGRGACLNGIFGTSPVIIEDYIRDEGYNYKTLEGEDARDVEKLNNLQEKYDAYIVTAYVDETNITEAIHTMCITEVVVDDEVKYILRNVSGDIEPQDSIYDCIEAYKDGNSKAICVIGISN